MLSWFSLPPSYGWTGYYDNIGDMTNTGVEIDLSGTIIQTRNVAWSANFNITYYKNKLAYLAPERKTTTVDGVNGYMSGNFFYGEGIPLYSYYMYKYAYPDPDTGDALYWHRTINEAGKEELVAVPYQGLDTGGTNDYFIVGSTLPKAYGGFGTSVEFFGFDFSIDFTYSCGGKILDSMYQMFMSSPISTSIGNNFHQDLINAWTPENRNTNIPILKYNDQYAGMTSDRFLTDASYLNLQTINFGYTFPRKWMEKLQIENLRVYFAADNIYYWSKRKGLDPRQSITGGGNATYYSPIRTLTGGLSVTF